MIVVKFGSPSRRLCSALCCELSNWLAFELVDLRTYEPLDWWTVTDKSNMDSSAYQQPISL